MKDLFFEYYKPNKAFFDKIWKDPIYAFDTNVLLDAFRSSEETYKELIRTFKILKDKIWIPYQVASEYHKNLNKVIEEQYEKYDKPLKYLNSFEECVNKTREHPFIEYEVEINILKNRLKDGKEKLKKLISDNTKAYEISNILGKCIGSKFAEDELRKLYKEADDRYKNDIPPGFKDDTKSNKNKYGDFIIWKELIKKSKTDKKDIIFVTNDIKRDWFVSYINDSKIPHPQLKREFRENTKKDIYLYTLDDFLGETKLRNIITVKEETIEEIKNRRIDYTDILNKLRRHELDIIGKFDKKIMKLKGLEKLGNIQNETLKIKGLSLLESHLNDKLKRMRNAYNNMDLNDIEE